ncbi:unnamed protein product [Psylliodes chrysocephalus]|uniref:DUF7869 domain-containing protein n=1 Tax=Psylliodes chrysocephalus TaxID=3402493 RepID=A0A9P0GGZ9_9CUCU|nr:unnamed protein product [Psylliodes chrysocephala]
MASCLMIYINSISKTITSIIIWTDNCPSQNQNIQMIMWYFYILAINPQIKQISHKFLLRGHTHMEVDSIHSVIEQESKECPNYKIMTPWHWMQLARLSGKNKDYVVFEMTTPDFKDFNKLYNIPNAPFQNCKKTEKGEKFLISKVVLKQGRQDSPGVLFFKSDFDQEFDSIDFNRRGSRKQHLNIENSLLTPLREIPNLIISKKYTYLQKLLKWVPKIFHPFYQNLAQ